jgi:hypothetical protein
VKRRNKIQIARTSNRLRAKNARYASILLKSSSIGLPEELWLEIICALDRKLDLDTILALRLVSSTFRRLASRQIYCRKDPNNIKMTTDNSSDDLRGTAEIEIPSLGFWFQRNAEHPGFSQSVKEIEICVPDRLVCAEPGEGDKKLNKAHTQLLARVKGPAPPLHDLRPLARETPETLENKYKTILMFLCDGLEAAQFTEQPGVDAPTRDRSKSGMPSIDSSTGGAIALLRVSDFLWRGRAPMR